MAKSETQQEIQLAAHFMFELHMKSLICSMKSESLSMLSFISWQYLLCFFHRITVFCFIRYFSCFLLYNVSFALCLIHTHNPFVF